MFTIACQSHDFSLDMEACPCVDELPGPIGLIPGHQSTPTSKRKCTALTWDINM